MNHRKLVSFGKKAEYVFVKQSLFVYSSPSQRIT